jgi:hypothetical protein
MRPFSGVFSPCLRGHVLVLVAGAVLSPGRRTVTAALRLMGLDQTPDFALYHRVLSTARWSARLLARRVLLQLIATFVADGPIVIGLDDTIERRWGAKIAARGIYRDPVRSSHGHFVKTSGLRWLCLMVLVPVPGAGSVWSLAHPEDALSTPTAVPPEPRKGALPFLSVRAPSERYARTRGRRHKTLTDWARQALLQTKRWLPERALVAVADRSFSALDLLCAVTAHVCVVTRLRLDAALYAPPRQPGAKGRPRVKGARLPSLIDRLTDPATVWTRITLQGWYGKTERRLAIASGTALWNHAGRRVAIRWVLVRDLEGEKDPQAFLCTDLTVEPATLLGWFVRRWRMEVTLEETRRHLGVETQRQWSDRAILRTTPALFGLFSLVTLWANQLYAEAGLPPENVRWYRKPDPTFSDALALVRRELGIAPTFGTSRDDCEVVKIPLIASTASCSLRAGLPKSAKPR